MTRAEVGRQVGEKSMEILGIDIGGSGIKGAPVNTDSGELLADRYRLPTPDSAKPDPMAATVAEIVQHFKWQGPVGCGFPAVVKEGVVYTAANVSKQWIGVNANQLIQEATHCPAMVINDADAAGLAEMRFGAGRDQHGVVLVVTLGTGIGTALFSAGQLVPNLELGHLEIRGVDAEELASDAARQRQDMSWDKWAKRVDLYLTTLERLLWPDLIIVGGGVSKKYEKFLPLLTLRTKVVPAEMRNEAGIVGAALGAIQGPSQFSPATPTLAGEEGFGGMGDE
jgi:polyphosphate glucokinase